MSDGGCSSLLLPPGPIHLVNLDFADSLAIHLVNLDFTYSLAFVGMGM